MAQIIYSNPLEAHGSEATQEPKGFYRQAAKLLKGSLSV